MGFYSDWIKALANGEDDIAIIAAFLNSVPESTKPFHDADPTGHAAAYEVLNAVPNERVLDVVASIDIPRTLIPADVPCFSTFENGAVRLNELLEFEAEGLTFSDAGYQLMNSVKPGAKTKYGENHSKLAAMMDLVTISDTRPVIVKPTAWGSYLTKYELRRKHDVLKKLLLRDLCVKTIVKAALQGQTSYREAVKVLSPSTALRRRSNVRYLVEYVLTGTEREDALSRIDWEL